MPQTLKGAFSARVSMHDRLKYNPQIHHRWSIRLQGYDYSKPGLYFITICSNNREHRFGYITGASIRSEVNSAPMMMILNGFGQIAHDEWADLPNRFPNIELGEFVIMPNHMHGIISIIDITTNDERPVYTIGNIVGAYKSLVAKKCLELHLQKSNNVGVGFTPTLNNTDKYDASIRAGVNPAPTTMGKIWQRNYYEHIIRNEESHNKIADYIANNPTNWHEDKFYS
ncbi:MAG: hypothetical protein K0Q79_58 [Flavipsychrobacter sp.]|jgi:REP element-mobilizing transposase RayT|nr:hypothetical protein [Flavipsychrobacter sp.]